MNALCLGARVIGPELARELVKSVPVRHIFTRTSA